MQENEPKNSQIDLIRVALNSPNIQRIYANGFSCAVGNGDVTLLLRIAENPTAVLHLSYTLAKTLAQKLDETIKFLEKKTGNTIMTSDEINNFLSKP